MQQNTFSESFAGLTTGFTPVVDAGFSMGGYIYIDLSVNNQALGKQELASPEKFEEYLVKYLEKSGKKVAYGGYLEKRGLYNRSELFSVSEKEGSNRNIHLGIDIWIEEKTPVLAVLPGKVHSYRDNKAFGDYGSTIILEHKAGNFIFYTLYGHLSRNSLNSLEEGQEVEQGEKIAELGAASENGDYAPHLHFQIMRDLEGKKGDYPGVASEKEIQFYLKNCPDPNLLLKIH